MHQHSVARKERSVLRGRERGWPHGDPSRSQKEINSYAVRVRLPRNTLRYLRATDAVQVRYALLVKCKNSE